MSRLTEDTQDHKRDPHPEKQPITWRTWVALTLTALSILGLFWAIFRSL